MFKREWKQLFSKPLLLGTMIVMMFIPIIYGGFFLGASWDPYGKTEKLPVAVVNQDEPAEYEGNTLSVGEELVSNLEKNNDLEWHFTNAKEAEQGMQDGEYFMVLTIPEDFSANASTVMDTQPKPMDLQYEINPGRGFFIETVSKQATSNIKEEIAESVTKEYVKAVFEQIETIGDGMGEAADGARQLDEGTVQLQEGNAMLTEKLGELASGSLTFQDGAEQLEVGTLQFAEGANALDAGAAQLHTGIFTYTGGVASLQTGIADLANGASLLDSKGAELVSGTQAMANGADKLVPGAQQLNTGLSEAQKGSGKLNDGLHELQSQTNQLLDPASGIQQLADGQKSLNTGLADLKAGSASLQEGLSSLDNGLPDAGQIAGLQEGLAGVQESAGRLNGLAGEGTASGTASLQSDLAAAQQDLSELQNASQPNAVEAIKNTAAFSSLTAEQQAELTAAAASVQTQSVGQEHIEALASDLSALSNDLNNDVIPAFQALGSLPEQLASLNSAIDQVNPAAAQALGGYASVHEALSGQLMPGAAALNAGLAEAAAGSDQLLAGTEKTAGSLPQLAGAVNQLAQGSSSLTEGMSALAQGSSGLVEGAGSLQKGAAELQNGTSAYTAGVSEVAQGAGQLEAGTDELASNSAALNSGAASLADGAQQLAGGLPKLTEGAEQLASGAAGIHEGAGALENGAGELSEGISKLADGSSELAGSLSEGARDINGTQLTDDNIEMIAAPATTTESALSEVPNYGHALAPYILSLGLYVGALSFNLVFPPLNAPAGQLTSGTAWWFSKFSLGVIQATASALIVDVIMLFGFHLQVGHIGEFIAISIVTSLAYMFLIMFLSLTLGNPGRFLAMIILVLQLGASGGMFPIELTNSFFQKAHDFVPMSYALLGFRESMSSAYGMETFVTSMAVLGGFFLFFNVLLWLVLSLRTRKALKLAAAN